MTELAAVFVSQLINDKLFVNFTESYVEQRLMERAIDERYRPLHALRSVTPSGDTEYLIYKSPQSRRYWNNDHQLVDSQWNVLSPLIVDQMNGRWTFATDQRPDVLITGYSFDPYGTAAALLQEHAGTFQNEPTSMSVYNGSFSYQQWRGAAPLKMVDQYLKMARYEPVAVVRNDVNVW